VTDSDVPTECILDERLEIETPERVKISYDLAGIGSRFAAGTIDVFLLALVFLVVGVLVVVVASIRIPDEEGERIAFGIAAAGSLYVVLSLYYVGFELAWHGQTPGKRVLKLRVLSDGGGPAPTGAVVVRNILRAADLVPFAAPYALGGLVMFVNRRSKRIGDYAAGTIVVRERVQPRAPSPRTEAPVADALPAADLERIRAFTARAPQMVPASRAALASRIAEDVASRHGLAFGEPEQFLRLLASGKTPRELRDAQGPKA
jgi:uncharacterized RDD family membrane protein YckC